MTDASTRSDGADGNEVAPTELWTPHQRPPIAPIAVRIIDAARMLGIGRSKIYELIDSGEIEIVKLGRSTLILVDSLHALVERLRAEQSGN
jgi:excisionase family DNA binding protein